MLFKVVIESKANISAHAFKINGNVHRIPIEDLNHCFFWILK